MGYKGHPLDRQAQLGERWEQKLQRRNDVTGAGPTPTQELMGFATGVMESTTPEQREQLAHAIPAAMEQRRRATFGHPGFEPDSEPDRLGHYELGHSREYEQKQQALSQEGTPEWDRIGMTALLELDDLQRKVAQCRAQQSHNEDWAQRHPDPAVCDSYRSLANQWRIAGDMGAEEIRRIEHP